jgi:hydrogenase nickel incorporation protein HypB
VDVHTSLLARNDHEAAHLRQHFATVGVTALNLMGSPGSGKTALLEATARALGQRYRLAAVSGDLATERDAERLAKAGIRSAAITTGTACHLDASMVHHALHGPLAAAVAAADFFFIENVGNLVCPAIYDLGQVRNVVCLSLTEGVDKPLKYPVMFRHADLVVLTKTDLLPYLDIDLAELHANIAQVMPHPRVIETAATRNLGLDAWIAWLEDLHAARPNKRRPLALNPADAVASGPVVRLKRD